jgi:hypothetical protein
MAVKLQTLCGTRHADVELNAKDIAGNQVIF